MKKYRILKAVEQTSLRNSSQEEYKIQWKFQWSFFSLPLWFDVTAPIAKYGGQVDYFGNTKVIKGTVYFGSVESAKAHIKLLLTKPSKKKWEVLQDVVTQKEAEEWRNL